MKYDRIIFAGNDNICRSVMAEAVFRQLYRKYDDKPEIMSRGLAVLFEEPYNPKAMLTLKMHGIEINEGMSAKLSSEELGEGTLVLTMGFADKLRIIEDYEYTEEVYTLKEFIGNDDELLDPYGEELDIYEACYQDIYEVIEQVVKKLNEEDI